VKKTAIIGIVIAIIVAGIVGIYAVSITQEGTSATESEIGLGDEAGVTIQEPEDTEEEQAEEPLGLGDKATATVENPEEEEKLGLGDKAEATVEELEEEEKLGLGDKAVATVENP